LPEGRGVSKSGGSEPKAAKERAGVGGVILAGRAEIAIRSEVEPGEAEVTEGGEGLRSRADVGGMGVLTKDRITEPVLAVLDPPVAPP
jgi:hypothetical protein